MFFSRSKFGSCFFTLSAMATSILVSACLSKIPQYEAQSCQALSTQEKNYFGSPSDCTLANPGKTCAEEILSFGSRSQVCYFAAPDPGPGPAELSFQVNSIDLGDLSSQKTVGFMVRNTGQKDALLCKIVMLEDLGFFGPVNATKFRIPRGGRLHKVEIVAKYRGNHGRKSASFVIECGEGVLLQGGSISANFVAVNNEGDPGGSPGGNPNQNPTPNLVMEDLPGSMVIQPPASLNLKIKNTGTIRASQCLASVVSTTGNATPPAVFTSSARFDLEKNSGARELRIIVSPTAALGSFKINVGCGTANIITSSFYVSAVKPGTPSDLYSAFVGLTAAEACVAMVYGKTGACWNARSSRGEKSYQACLGLTQARTKDCSPLMGTEGFNHCTAIVNAGGNNCSGARFASEAAGQACKAIVFAKAANCDRSSYFPGQVLSNTSTEYKLCGGLVYGGFNSDPLKDCNLALNHGGDKTAFNACAAIVKAKENDCSILFNW